MHLWVVMRWVFYTVKISKKSKKELINASKSSSLKRDMQKVSANSSNPFVKDGKPNVDAYIEFVNQFNEFINHAFKPFKPLIEKDMKL